jgi:uncharacterized membrane protein YfcA
MSLLAILKIGGVMMLGSIIQSSSGFGFGLFAIPILLFFGFDLSSTVIMIVIASAIQKVTAINALKERLTWREMAPFMFTGLAALPLGVFAMSKVSGMDQAAVKQVIGFLVLAVLLLRWKGTIQPRDDVPKKWGYVAGFFSGLLNGFANIGGPPLVLWTLSQNWSNKKMRGTILAFSLIFVPFQITMMLYTFGSSLFIPILKVLMVTPAVLTGTCIGLTIGGKISRRNLEIYMQSLLFFIAISAIVKPFL